MSADRVNTFSIESFMQSYRQGTHFSKDTVQRVADACGRALRQAQILHEITYTTPPSARLEGELKMREALRGKPYTQNDEIEADVILASVLVQVHLPQERSHVSQIICENFEIHHRSARTVDGIGTAPEPTNLCTEYYWVSLKEENVWPPRLVEVQVATDEGDREFRTQDELVEFLSKWAVLIGMEVKRGDVQPLWELLNVPTSQQVRDFRDFLAGLNLSAAPDLGSDYARRAREFEPGLEFSLAMYVADSLMRSPRGNDGIQRAMSVLEEKPEAEQQREKMKILRDSLIWLVRFGSWGEGATDMLFDGLDKALQTRQLKRIVWLNKPCARDFLDDRIGFLTNREVQDLEQLWLLFARHNRAPAQYVFNLARLGIRGHSAPSWLEFDKAITDLHIIPRLF
ncbi:uncharacterized protein DSM5745_04836 [Aspergillus mulundensis]|uniref:Uncharacterized protein n=1 Tax=Aspergillus mulundensis TaxID=1810919 RepID=A0A3D8S4S2_9EURO|nr:hypothetical protein DSM5745_04836 [Aspergillus mulundensis]RDW81279.1 hypothetical protein DSM5745_04836 [Aspergillus mulundensis]